MFRFYLLVFWVPAFVSAITLRLLWSEGAVKRPVIAVLWFAVAWALQFFGGGIAPFAWALGLVLQTVLGLYLLIQWKLRVSLPAASSTQR